MKSEPIKERVTLPELPDRVNRYRRFSNENWVEYQNRIADMNDLSNGTYRENE